MATSTIKNIPTKVGTPTQVGAKPVAESKPTSNSAADTSVNNIEKTVQDHTPNFVSKVIVTGIDNLEYFRVTYFNHQIVFYPILGIFVFFLVRGIWRRFY